MRSDSTHRASSVRTSSSHRSTIETRGVPEFDLEYARQLSIAKRGRNSNVRLSPSPVLVPDSPRESEMQGPAVVAASRMKDYVVTHIAPSHSSRLRRTSEGASKALAEKTNAEEISEPTTLLSLTSTRRSRLLSDAAVLPASATDSDKFFVHFSVKEIFVIGLVALALLCATTFVMPVSSHFKPSFFFLSGAFSSPLLQIRSGVVDRWRWLSRHVPGFFAQVALHLRQVMGLALEQVGDPSVLGKLGSALVSVRTYVSGRAGVKLSRIDPQPHPVLQSSFSKEPKDEKEWFFFTIFNLAASVVRNMTQLGIRLLLFAGRAVQVLCDGVSGLVSFSSVPVEVHHVTSGDVLPAVTVPKANHTTGDWHTTSSTLLLLWRLPHFLWMSLIHASIADPTAPRNESALTSRMTNASMTATSSRYSSELQELPWGVPSKAMPNILASRMKLRTVHTRMLEGSLWSSLLDEHPREVGSLARDDLQELLRDHLNATRVVDVALRAGGLVMDIEVEWDAAMEYPLQSESDHSTEKVEGVKATQRSRRAVVEAKLQQWSFPHLRKLYSYATSAGNYQRRMASNKALVGAACKAWVAECHQQYPLLLYHTDRRFRNCTAWLKKTTPLHGASAGEVLGELHECNNPLKDCCLRASRLMANVSDRASRLALRQRRSVESPVDFAAAVSDENFTTCEVERRRCAAQLMTAAQGCAQRIRDTQRLLDTAYVRQVTAFKKCALERSALERGFRRREQRSAQGAETGCNDLLSKNVSGVRRGAAAVFAHLYEALAVSRAEADKRVIECANASERDRVHFDTERAQWNASLMARISSAELQCEAKLAALREETRVVSTAARWKAEVVCAERLAREVSMLNRSAAAASTHMQREVEDARLKGQRAGVVCGSFTGENEVDYEASLQRVREECQARRETPPRLQEAQLRNMSAQIASHTAQLESLEVVHQEAVHRVRQEFHAAVADTSNEACLQVTQHNLLVCGGVRKAIEEELNKLPANATPTDAFIQMLAHTPVRGQLAWVFQGTPAHTVQDSRAVSINRRSPRFFFYFHTTSVFICFASIYTLVKYSRKHRLYNEAIARLDTLIAANETTLSFHSKNNPSKYRSDFLINGGVSMGWTVMEACMANSSEALLAWHLTRCEFLLAQETNILQREMHQIGTASVALHADPMRSLPESVSVNSNVFCASRNCPSSRLTSASTLPLICEDDKQLSQLHAAFLSCYYAVLEMYYVDLLDAVAGRVLVKAQLQRAESMAKWQSAVLGKQLSSVAEQKGSLAQSEISEDALATQEKLERAERRISSQNEAIALLEQQLKMARGELNRATCVLDTRVPSLCGDIAVSTALEPANTKSRHVYSKGELAGGGPTSDSITTFPFSSVEDDSIVHREPPALLDSRATEGPIRTPVLQRATMVRDPDTTRRYHKLQWDDDDAHIE